MICEKLKHHLFPEELIYKGCQQLFKFFSYFAQYVLQEKRKTFLKKLSFEIRYLENEMEILKFLTSFWRQQCSKVLSQI